MSAVRDNVVGAAKKVKKAVTLQPIDRSSKCGALVRHAIFCDPPTFVDELAKEANVDLHADGWYAFNREILKKKDRLYSIFNVLYIICLILLWSSVILGVLGKAAETFGAKLPAAVGGVIVGLAGIASPGVLVFGFLKGVMHEDSNSSKAVCISLLMAAKTGQSGAFGQSMTSTNDHYGLDVNNTNNNNITNDDQQNANFMAQSRQQNYAAPQYHPSASIPYGQSPNAQLQPAVSSPRPLPQNFSNPQTK